MRGFTFSWKRFLGITRVKQQIAELTQIVESLKTRRSELERNRLNSLHRYAEMSHLCQSIGRSQSEITASLSRMLVLIAEEQQL